MCNDLVGELAALGVEVAVITALPLKALIRMTISSRCPIDATPPSELFDRADATQAIATAEAVIAFLEQLDRPGA
jgi:HEPN domain-containing protein